MIRQTLQDKADIGIKSEFTYHSSGSKYCTTMGCFSLEMPERGGSDALDSIHTTSHPDMDNVKIFTETKFFAHKILPNLSNLSIETLNIPVNCF